MSDEEDRGQKKVIVSNPNVVRMRIGKTRRYLLHRLLILCCLYFCLSGCPSNEIIVSGEVTCEKCESGKITISVSDCNLNRIVEKTLDGCGTYSILIPPTYIGKQVYVAVHCDEDNDGEFSLGDHGRWGWVELQITNEVNINVNQEFTAAIEGEVSCAPHTDGLIYIYAFDGPLNKTSPPSYIGGPLLPVNLNEKTSYKVLLPNISLGSEVWLLEHWDKDGSGICQIEETVNGCDYVGYSIPVILESEETTGIDLDACQFLIRPCLEPIPEETPQDEYAIDNLSGSDNPPYELDEEILTELVDHIEAGDFDNIHSLIIIHNDSLILEEYFMGRTRHMLHYCYCTTKGVTSALIGIAIDHGKLNGVDEKLLSFFPEYDDIVNLDERKESITLENVLTNSAGFAWDNETSEQIMRQSRNWIKYVLDCPMSDNPGTKFLYNNGNSHLLSGILTNKTGQSAEEFAEENIFSKIGITKWEWETDPNGITYGAAGLSLHPVNMAMFGYLYLKNGLLNGEQIVPEDWVKESTIKHIAFYGYQWWMLPNFMVEEHPEADGAYYAAGGARQRIFIIPNLNMVVATTAENFEDHQGSAFDILLNYILPALKEK